MWDFPLFPEQASTTAPRVDAVYFALIGMTIFFVALIYGLMLVFMIKYRSGSKASREGRVSHSKRLELVWIVIPTILGLSLFLWASRVFFELYNPPPDAAEVYVVGKQWMWYLQHPEGKRETNELHVPVGRPVKLVMTSQDVIHSFYVPAFRVKQDVLPGRYTMTWFEPTKPGKYHLFCAEYCGTNHSGMIGSVYVMEPDAYQEWLAHGSTGATMAQEGERLFRQYHCGGCHGNDSATRAPSLAGIYGGPVPIREGNTTRLITADDRYVRDSILMPQSQVVAGYEADDDTAPMPVYQGQIDERDLLRIVAYIKSLGRKGTTR